MLKIRIIPGFIGIFMLATFSATGAAEGLDLRVIEPGKEIHFKDQGKNR
ncbi:MAG: hypothetical protein PHV51_10825 [Methanosarcinaceae archaeon]|nr:hypothetical protein [Methanosarcinaceae archaeon]